MSRPKISATISAMMAAAVITVFPACSLVSLEELVISTHPADDGEVLPVEGPVRVSFSIEPVRSTAERAFKLSSPAGISSGDFLWSGNELAFYPIPPLRKGCRCQLSVIGGIRTTDGRAFEAAASTSFHAGSKASPLALDSFSPARGATVSTTQALSFAFSRSVDPSLFRRSFSLDPSTDYDLAWSADGKVATITPRSRWTTLTAYAWQVKADLADAEGLAMARAVNGTFVVQADGQAPSVVSVRPAIFTNAGFSPLAVGLDQLGCRDAIYLTFSEDVSRESAVDAIKLTPAVRGRVLQDGPRNFAFLPEEDYAARTRYRLCLLSSVCDLAGNTMSEDYLAWFSPRVADLKVDRVFVAGGAAITVLGDSPGHGFRPRIPDGSAMIAVEFNSPIVDPGQRDRMITLISCTSLFPSALSPSPMSAQWPSPSRLEMSFAGFTQSTASSTFFYKFLLPGGTSGISDGAGGTMETDACLVLFTE